jgi:hypothetical protein
MSVPAEISLETIQNELAEAIPYASAAHLVLEASGLSVEQLKFSVAFHNRAGEIFYTEFDCREYPLFPPTIEFTDEARQGRGLKHLYPNVFHTAPCVCMRYNRKAYGELGGPHGDWRLVDWHLPTSGGGPITTLAMMISDLHTKTLDATGRMS